jgi:pimeloyl-ACP methyl ester carboxylesterase
MNTRQGRNRELDLITKQYEVGDPESVLAMVTSPVLILWSGARALLPSDDLKRFKQWLCNAPVSTIVYEDVGHKLFIDAPERTVSDTSRFLAEALKKGT